jgi:hypothetical protein
VGSKFFEDDVEHAGARLDDAVRILYHLIENPQPKKYLKPKLSGVIA